MVGALGVQEAMPLSKMQVQSAVGTASMKINMANLVTR